MLYIPQNDVYLKVLTDDEVKDFVATNFSECFKTTREILCSKISEEQNPRKIVKSLYIFLKIPDEIEKYAKMMLSSSSDKLCASL